MSGRAKRRAATRGIYERTPGSGVWYVCFFDQHGRKHRKKVGPKSLAKEFYSKCKSDVAERRFFPDRLLKREVPLTDAIDDCLERSKNLRAYKEYERAAENWRKELAGKTLSQVTPGDLDRYRVKRIEGGASAGTFNRELSFLRRVFNLAIADGKITASPVRGVKFLKENPPPDRFLSEEEEARLASELQPSEWDFVQVALCTGLRRSEQFGLRWEYVDFGTGFLTIPRSKHGQSRRVRMNDTVIRILQSLPSRETSPWVFPGAKGKNRQDPQNFVWRIFMPALERAQIKNFRWHDLRHTFASRLVIAGVPLRTVQVLMGHKTIAMTERYSHLAPGHLLDAVQSLNSDRTGTRSDSVSDTEPPTPRRHRKVRSQVRAASANSRAGDRGRTGDVQLGKLERARSMNPRRSWFSSCS